MSRCEEYKQKMLVVGDRISELKAELLKIHSPDEYDRIKREIAVLEREEAILKGKWEGCLKRGGC